MANENQSQVQETSRALLGAYRKGRRAAQLNCRRQSPYADKRGGRHQHIVTYSRAFSRFWLDGWDDEANNKPERYCLRGLKPPFIHIN